MKDQKKQKLNSLCYVRPSMYNKLYTDASRSLSETSSCYEVPIQDHEDSNEHMSTYPSLREDMTVTEIINPFSTVSVNMTDSA